MADEASPLEKLAAFVRRTEDAASAYTRRDMDRYLTLTRLVHGIDLEQAAARARG